MFSFYQRGNIARYASGGIATIEMAICLSVCHTLVFYQSKHHDFFTDEDQCCQGLETTMREIYPLPSHSLLSPLSSFLSLSSVATGGGANGDSCPPTLARLDPEIIENPSRNFSGGGRG